MEVSFTLTVTQSHVSLRCSSTVCFISSTGLTHAELLPVGGVVAA